MDFLSQYLASLSIFGVLSSAFWIWMLIDCYRNEDERWWLLVLFFTHFLGAILYFFLRKLGRDFRAGESPLLAGFFLGGKVAAAESAARRIGNTWQDGELGGLYAKTGKTAKAKEAFVKAVEKDAGNEEALWGLASLLVKEKEWAASLARLETLLAKNPAYGYGDASLFRLRCLWELGRKPIQEAGEHLRKWPHAEATFYRASLLAEGGKKEEALNLLENEIADDRAAPKFDRKRNGKWIAKCKGLLGKLKAG